MAEIGKDRNLGIRGTVSRRKFLKQKALDQNTSVQAFVDAAIDHYVEWLERPSTQPSPASRKDSIPHELIPVTIQGYPKDTGITVTVDEFNCIRDLLEVLRGQVPHARAALESNLSAFSKLTRVERNLADVRIGPELSPADPSLGTPDARLRRNEKAIAELLDQLHETTNPGARKRKAP